MTKGAWRDDWQRAADEKAELEARYDEVVAAGMKLVEENERHRDAIASLTAERERLAADAKQGWDQFYKLRKSVAEARYPGMTNEVKEALASVPQKGSTDSGGTDGG